MPEESDKPRYMRVEDFFRSAQATTIAEDVRAEMRKERERTILDLALLRQMEAWSHLAGKVVGAEGE